MLRLLVVEDHALVREGLMETLKNLEDEVETLGAQDADAALEILAADSDIDLILLDLMLPGTSGKALLGVLRKRYPGIPVVVLSAQDDPETVSRVMRQGASGFAPKSSSTEVLLDALHRVLDGEIFLPARYREPGESGAANGGKTFADRYGLTNAQLRVLELLAQGKTNRQIAELLEITEGTVKIHVSAILKALNVANRSQALLVVNRQKAPRA